MASVVTNGDRRCRHDDSCNHSLPSTATHERLVVDRSATRTPFRYSNPTERIYTVWETFRRMSVGTRRRRGDRGARSSIGAPEARHVSMIGDTWVGNRALTPIAQVPVRGSLSGHQPLRVHQRHVPHMLLLPNRNPFPFAPRPPTAVPASTRSVPDGASRVSKALRSLAQDAEAGTPVAVRSRTRWQ